MLDAMPGTWNMSAGDKDPDGVLKVMSFLANTPLPIPDRHWLKKALAEAGFTPLVVEWLAANLKRHAAGHHGDKVCAAAPMLDLCMSCF